MIKYLGSKRKLLPYIEGAIQHIKKQGHKVDSVFDAFSGTSRVGHHLKGKGYQVVSNDINYYAYILAKCYVETNRADVLEEVEAHLEIMRSLAPKEGFFTENYCKKAWFFHPKNGAKIDVMRDWIEDQDLSENVKAVLLVSLMEAADRVDSTCGIQMAYLKKWAPRALKDLELRIPQIVDSNLQCKAVQGDIFDTLPTFL